MAFDCLSHPVASVLGFALAIVVPFLGYRSIPQLL
jgi:hypothetical protein